MQQGEHLATQPAPTLVICCRSAAVRRGLRVCSTAQIVFQWQARHHPITIDMLREATGMGVGGDEVLSLNGMQLA